MAEPVKQQPAAGRTYGGRSHEERRELRRERLISGALEQFGTLGYEATTVKSICEAAGLTERYFYEHFSSRLDCFEAVFEHAGVITAERSLSAAASAPMTLALRVHAGLEGYLSALSESPELARVLLIDAVGRSEKLERRRFELMRDFAAAIEREAVDLDPDADASVSDQAHAITLALVGGTNHLAVEWTRGDLRLTKSELVDALASLYVAAADVGL